MKWMIASDIHGSAYYCEKMLEAFQREQAQRLLLLGDLLYHGPRNDLPRDYAPKKVIAMLNSLTGRVSNVGGNCDADVDQMVLNFPVLAEYALINVSDHLFFATHGHRFSADNPPPLSPGEILLTGHTHIPACEERGHFLYVNPGSISIPKADSQHSYMVIDEEQLLWKELENGSVYRTHLLHH